MTNIEIRINGAAAVKGKQDGLLTAGMVGATVGFSFDGLWDGLSKTAVFKCGGMVRDVIGVEDTARIPAEVLCADTELYVGVEGRSGDGAVVIPTVWVRAAYVYPGANASGDPSTDPALPVWAQIQDMIGDLAKLHTADKSSLVAAINEALRSGGGAVDEDTVARLVEEHLEANPPVVIETDPTVPDWAKQPEKPKYTAEEVGALSKGTKIPATAADVGAIKAPDTATVGQTIVVKEVDEDGKPVSWECTDVAGGGSGGWRTIADITLEEPAAPIKIDTDMDGNSFSLKEVEIYFRGKTYTRETGAVTDKTVIRVCYNATVWSWATTAYNDEAGRARQFVRSIFTGTEIISLGHGDSVLKQQVLNSKATSAKSIVISNNGSDGTIAFAEGTRVIVRGLDAK